MSRWKKYWFAIRVYLIRLIAGKSIATMTNVTLAGIVYPRGDYVLASHNLIMGNFTVKANSENLEDVHDQVNVDSST